MAKDANGAPGTLRKRGAYALAENIVIATASCRATWNDLHQLETALLELEPLVDLERRRWSLRADYRAVAGSAEFQQYEQSLPPDDFITEESLRAELI